MRDVQMVAHIPYDYTPAKYHSVASEAATMTFLHTSGLPVPRVYGYSPDTDNAAGTEYILMEHIQANHQTGSADDGDFVPCCLYYTRDLKRLGAPHITLEEDARFSVGPDSRPRMWSGRRAELDVDRGPYTTAEALLLGGAEKELAFLNQFGQPRLPLVRLFRAAYGNREKKQQPALSLCQVDGGAQRGAIFSHERATGKVPSAKTTTTNPEEARRTKFQFEVRLMMAKTALQCNRDFGCRDDTWAPAETFEDTLARTQVIKRLEIIAALPESMRDSSLELYD
ncbi:hypothetical protein FB45DRAFT_1086280 [Roridomyces roridus]|uniref:Aminoglycoside phosphotransferase domain-containing protein n=1 Tax=Roridomyces roridus TaxID=1738132 RepID=A0AAD7BLU0_9AGAR|nr:hypothetical protein FB45DRAFT_1086280 [Roridomyces roridus]